MTASTPRTLALRPFRAVRYAADATTLGQLIAPPYDVIDEAEHSALEAADPHNVVRIILPREPAAGDRYTAAAQTFGHWLDDATLTVDDEPALYVYQQRRDGEVLQRGIFGAVVMQPLDGGVILPHENVRTGPVEDRLALMRAMLANPEPIFLLYDGGGPASALSAAAVERPPLASALTPDGITHELWPITDAAELTTIADDLAGRQAMIADGHHRYTTYGYLRDELHAAGNGAGPWDAGLTLLVDDSVATPDIRAIHRVIPAFTFDAATERAAKGFDVRDLEPGTDAAAALMLLDEVQGPAFVVSDGASFALLSSPDASALASAKPADRTGAWWDLDASVAAVLVMETLWSVSDAAGQVEAEHDPTSALRMARETGGVALLLKAAPLAGIMAVARAGDAMPRKSTLFLPKPRSGIVMRAFRFDS